MKSLLLRGFADVGLFSIVTNLLLLVTPLFLMQVYDRVLPSASIETLAYLSLIALVALGFLGLFDVLRMLYAHHVANDISWRAGDPVFRHLVSEARSDRNDIAPLRNIMILRSFIGSKGLLGLFDLPFAPIFAVLLYFVHPLLFWVTLAGVITMLLLLFGNLFLEQESSRNAAEQTAAANLFAQALSRHSDSVKAMGMIENTAAEWSTRFACGLRQHGRSAGINSLFGGVSRIARMLLQLAIIGTGAWLAIKGELTAGMIFASSIISGRALQPIDQVIAGWRQIGEGIRAWRQLKPFLKEVSPTTMVELPEPKGSIHLENLIYQAEGGVPGQSAILKRINITIDAGDSVAIVGPSRAGKTTLARLIVGAAKPSSGLVRIDGADLETWNSNQRSGLFGYLAQDIQLLPGSIAQNISRFEHSACDRDIVEAAQMAHAHDLILSQSRGYQTEIAATGPILSGGERQRIGLARAFYKSPRILVLDEPNANLDADGERALIAALGEAKRRQTTVLLITHRVAIAGKCDKTLLLKDGIVEAFGATNDILQNLNKPARTAESNALQSNQPSFVFSFDGLTHSENQLGSGESM